MDNTEEGLQESTDLIAYYTSYAGLKINAKKTQCMAISKCASQRPYTERDSIMLTVEGEPVEQVSNFVCLFKGISQNFVGSISSKWCLEPTLKI